MAVAGYVIELVFGGLGLVPGRASATIPDSGVSWDYTTWLNIAFLVLAAVLVVRFARTGGGMMLKMMGGAPEQPGEDGQAHHDTDGRPTGTALTRRPQAVLRGSGYCWSGVPTPPGARGAVLRGVVLGNPELVDELL